MRLTIRTNLAARVLMSCAVNPERILRTGEIAARCNASPDHLLQVVGLLRAGGFIHTIRGRTGGLRLARPAHEISLGALFRMFEAAVPFAECFDAATNACPLAGSCRLQGFIAEAVEAFYRALDGVTVADLVNDNCGLSGLLSMPDGLAAVCLRRSRGRAGTAAVQAVA